MKAVLAREGREGEKKQSPRISWTLFFFKARKKRVQEILGLCFFSDHFSPMSGTLFFFKHLNWQVLSITRMQLFGTKVLDIHLGGLKASCIGSAVSKFRPSVGDGATYCIFIFTNRISIV